MGLIPELFLNLKRNPSRPDTDVLRATEARRVSARAGDNVLCVGRQVVGVERKGSGKLDLSGWSRLFG